MKSDTRILFSRCRDQALIEPARSRDYKKFIIGGMALDPHHVFGSVHGLKSTDYGIVAVSPLEHQTRQNQDEVEWGIDLLPQVFRNNWRYIQFLENKLKGK